MNVHRFILQPYRGVGTRHSCPACNLKRCFSRYIDTEKEISFPDEVGRCDHEQSCGYHLTPKEYFAQNPQSKRGIDNSPAPYFQRTPIARNTEPRTAPSFIAAKTVEQTLHGYEQNNLFLFLRSRFGAEIAMRLMKGYRVGTSRHWPGACVFWQTDIDGNTRTGKVMLYDAENGKRVKHPFNHVTWVHSLLRLPDFNLRQCFFGEHLLPMNRGKPLAIVESEKTALIATQYLPQYVWLATGGKHGCFNSTALSVLSGRDVILYPDVGATTEWSGKLSLLRQLGIKADIFDYLEDMATEAEKTEGLDLADYLLRIETDEAILQTLLHSHPHLQQLFDELQCELVSVERFYPTTEIIQKSQKQ